MTRNKGILEETHDPNNTGFLGHDLRGLLESEGEGGGKVGDFGVNCGGGGRLRGKAMSEKGGLGEVSVHIAIRSSLIVNVLLSVRQDELEILLNTGGWELNGNERDLR